MGYFSIDNISQEGAELPAVKEEPVSEEGEEELLVKGSTLGLLRQGAVGVAEFALWLESVWFRQVAKPNFLLADSYHVHTAAPTQAALLKVSLLTNEMAALSVDQSESNIVCGKSEDNIVF